MASPETVGSELRASLILPLRDEGLTIEAIAGLFGVTRQRISALLKQKAAIGDLAVPRTVAVHLGEMTWSRNRCVPPRAGSCLGSSSLSSFRPRSRPEVARRLRIARPLAYLAVLAVMLIVAITILERIEEAASPVSTRVEP